MKIPEDIRTNAEAYIALTSNTLDSLAFLHDNLGITCNLDLSPESIDDLWDTLRWLHNHPNPESLFPDVVETHAQLVAQYVALVYLDSAECFWRIDAVRSSANYGQPFVDVVPTEPWRRYYPIHWQIALKNPKVFLGAHVWPLARQTKENLAARERYARLLSEIVRLVG